jgi:putative addiction module CopG family antidote
MQIELPHELERYLSDSIASGDFTSRQELLIDAVRLHRERTEKLRTLRADLQFGVDALNRGEGHTLRTPAERRAFFEEIEREGRVGLDESQPE